MTLADPPSLDKASISRFLLTCPMLQGLTPAQIEPLAEHLRLHRYEDGTRLLHDVVADGDTPLRVLVRGRASWDPADSTDHKGAWRLTPGSMAGLGAINHWAREAGVEGTWPRTELSRIRCQAMGPITVLELAPARFDTVFRSPGGAAVCSKLLAMFPTIAHGHDIVAALRQSAEFSRVNVVSLYRLLEHAPTRRFDANIEAHPDHLDPDIIQDLDQDPKQILDQDKQNPAAAGPIVGGQDLYYVLKGELCVAVDDGEILMRTGSMGGHRMFENDGLGPVARREPTATTETHAVVVSRHALTMMMRAVPGFARSLGPLERGERVTL